MQSEIQESVSRTEAAVKKMDKRLETLERLLQAGHLGVQLEQDAPCETQYEGVQDGGVNGDRLLDKEEAARMVKGMDEEELEKQLGLPTPPGEHRIPANHTAPTSLILTWPSVRQMVGDLALQQKIDYPEEFPIQQEQARGLLLGRSEDHDDPEPMEWEDTAMSGRCDMYSGPVSPASATDVHYENSRLTTYDNKAKVLEYMDSFEKNVLTMHPIILPSQLRALVQVFLDTHLQAGPKAPTAGTKRKRSPISDPDTVNAPYKPNKPSIDDGLALLVLALGNACLHKGKMPGVVHSDGLDGEQQQQSRGLPIQRSPPGSYSTSGLPSPKLEDRKGREGAKELGRQPPFRGIPMPKTNSSLNNYNVIPGLEYFAPATDILGNQMAGNTLKHVWAHILAGLYYDQLARPIESFTHITAASRALLIISRP